jgi:hypothetical protein
MRLKSHIELYPQLEGSLHGKLDVEKLEDIQTLLYLQRRRQKSITKLYRQMENFEVN